MKQVCHLFRFVKGFITRNEPVNATNARFQQLVKCEYLIRLSKSLPRSVLDRKWPQPPSSCTEASKILKVRHCALAELRVGVSESDYKEI